MVLRPFELPAAKSSAPMDAWEAVAAIQNLKPSPCWIVTQPSHAVLSGEIAKHLSGEHIPKLSEEAVRGIAMHDAGWGPVDAEVVRSRLSRDKQPARAVSFLEIAPKVFLDAWALSIETAAKFSPLGGYLVSRHFWRIGKFRQKLTNDPPADARRLQTFLDGEEKRQQKLGAGHSPEELERLTDVLQLTDVMSLYLCSGSREPVEFAQGFGDERVRMQPAGEDAYSVTPQVLPAGTRLEFAALPFPARGKAQEGRTFTVLIR